MRLTRKRGDAGSSFEAHMKTFIDVSGKETNKRSFETHVLPVVACLLQVLVPVCAHRPDSDRHRHWMHRDLVDKATKVILQERKGCTCVCVHTCAHALPCMSTWRYASFQKGNS